MERDGRLDAALDVAQRLRRFEALLDNTVCAGEALIDTLLAVRVQILVPDGTGEKALRRVEEALQHVLLARGNVAATHRRLDMARARLELPTFSFGDESEKDGPFTPPAMADSPDVDVRKKQARQQDRRCQPGSWKKGGRLSLLSP